PGASGTQTASGLRIRDLRVTFGGGRKLLGAGAPAVTAVAGVDLDVGPDETVAVVGESGSGKTTVARCVVGLVPPDS
ncbi:ATP-binding cassette domain-containing protein, partial [Phytoactinopolyspora endophytica]|uniref:ATP-binding cassette domain-containing protein n=1 Tax=Phytoactinopolyspora endophytica TaxID=1642495 RepID=UPI00197B967B